MKKSISYLFWWRLVFFFSSLGPNCAFHSFKSQNAKKKKKTKVNQSSTRRPGPNQLSPDYLSNSIYRFQVFVFVYFYNLYRTKCDTSNKNIEWPKNLKAILILELNTKTYSYWTRHIVIFSQWNSSFDSSAFNFFFYFINVLRVVLVVVALVRVNCHCHISIVVLDFHRFLEATYSPLPNSYSPFQNRHELHSIWWNLNCSERNYLPWPGTFFFFSK